MTDPTEPLPTPALWRELVSRLPVVVYVADFDEQGTLRWLSPQIEELLGVPAEAFLADDDLWYRCIHPGDVDRVRAEERRVHQAVEPFEAEYRMVAADGRVRTVWERDAIIFGPDGTPLYTQGAIVDVTARREAEVLAAEAARRGAEHLDLVGALVGEIGLDGRILDANPAIAGLLGRTPEELIGEDAFVLAVAPEDRERARANVCAIIAGTTESPQIELLAVDATGERHPIHWKWSVRRDDAGAPVSIVCLGIDLTEQRVAEQRAAYLARHDLLTDLPNRALLDEHLELAVARARRDGTGVGLLLLDVDDFGLVNDELGVQGGDDVLRRIATRLGMRRRAQDVLARVAGDEFAVVLTGLGAAADDEDVLAIAEDYQRTLQAPLAIGATLFDVDVSAGCAVFPGDAPEGPELLRRASLALAAAKADGPGSARRFRADADGRRRPLSLTARLRGAMTRDELELHWQPVVELPDGIVGGAEGLVRWRTPDGLLGPPAFVPHAEESRLIERLDDHVLDLACREIARWDGLEGRLMGVNVSAHTFGARGYVERVEETLHRHGVDPSRLVIELTESTVMRPDCDTVRALDRLRALGVCLAIDDFGVGFSSLARIIELPVSVAKLDRSFLARGADDPAVAGVIASMVAMSGHLGHRTLVEGVETQEQLDLLLRLGVPLAQGWLFGRPAPADEVFPLLGGVARTVPA